MSGLRQDDEYSLMFLGVNPTDRTGDFALVPSKPVALGSFQVLHIPGNLPHKAEALEDMLDVDIFSPPREDWINKTDAYLRR